VKLAKQWQRNVSAGINYLTNLGRLAIGANDQQTVPSANRNLLASGRTPARQTQKQKRESTGAHTDA
jgi:hypothetical protein